MQVGKNSKISPKVSIYGGDTIEVGENTRIDDFSILIGGQGLKIGNHVHIAAYSILYGTHGLTIGDFSGLAARTTILTSTDDYLGRCLIGPCVPKKYKPNYHGAAVVLERHVLMGIGCVVMPGIRIGEGASFGAFTFVNRDCDPWTLYVGVPAREIKKRSRDMLKFEHEFLEEYNG